MHMKISTLTVISFAFFFFACEEKEELFRQFVIPEGEHYSTTRLVQSLQSDNLVFEAKFDASAMYHFQETGFQDSKNKLLGFADCNSLHHENSARFAWQWFNDQLEIYAYCYVNSQRVEKFIGVVSIDELNHYELTLTDDYYIFQLNSDEPVSIERGNVCRAGLYYMLWPYFGGTLPAPHDVSIQLQILN
ncbi:MAG: hypothetical protein C0490_15210 [Marivirga sp.]|nr:hypothetical protein [Marivirga sp.]